MNGWNAQSDAAALLSGLGIPEEDHCKLLKELSGNQKVRVLWRRPSLVTLIFLFLTNLPTTWIYRP